ncbi:MAG: hypothetical protein AAFN30_06700 [Actinomycetota bacterium]
MGFWQTVKAWMSTEAAELKDATDGLESRLDRDLSARERQLNETPREAMERLQAEGAANESVFDELSDKITAAQATADAMAEMAETADGTEPHDADSNDAGASDRSTGGGPEELVIPESETEET